jgi:hypothetical protein
VHEGAALVHDDPAVTDRQFQAGAVLRGSRLVLCRNGQLTFSMWILPSCTGLNGVGNFKEAPRGFLGIGVGGGARRASCSFREPASMGGSCRSRTSTFSRIGTVCR